MMSWSVIEILQLQKYNNYKNITITKILQLQKYNNYKNITITKLNQMESKEVNIYVNSDWTIIVLS
jgi:hypothetical protein